jgi:hypothetical protein
MFLANGFRMWKPLAMKKNKSRRFRPWRFPNKETVRQAMKRADTNPYRLSLAIGISPQTACNWRDGRPVRPVYVPLLEKALGIAGVADV